MEAYFNLYFLTLIVSPIIFWLFLQEGKRQPKVDSLGRCILPHTWGEKILALGLCIALADISFSDSLRWQDQLIVVDFREAIYGLVFVILGILYQISLVRSKITYSHASLSVSYMFRKSRTFAWGDFESASYNPRGHEFQFKTIKGDKIFVSLFRIGSRHFIDAAQKYLPSWVSEKTKKDFELARQGYRLR